MKCTVKMGDKRAPVPGTVEGPEGKRTGTCPECDTPGVMLSIVGGYVRAHTVASAPLPENNPQAATVVDSGVRKDRTTGRVLKVGTGLREPATALVDTGVRAGDPHAAEARRVVDLNGAQHTGTVKIPVKSGGKGRAKLTEVPATEANVRACLAYWKGRTVRTDASRKRQSDMVSMLVAWLEAMRKGRGVLKAKAVDTASVHRGPTLVRGKAMDADKVTGPRERGNKPVRPLFEGPLGRERADRRIIHVPEPAPALSRSQKRNERRKAQRDAAILRAAGK